MSHQSSVASEFETAHVSLKTYIIGFVSCVVLTLLAYLAAVTHDLSNRAAIIIITSLAVLQLYVQLRKFLHLGDEQSPRLRLITFGVMISIVAILVLGSLWIMNNLNYRMMDSPQAQQRYVESQDGL